MSIHIHDIKATGTIQGSKLTANQAITGITMYLNKSIHFLYKSGTGWMPRFSIEQSDDGNGIISAVDTINIKGNTINIEGELLINGETPLHTNNFNTYAPSLTGAGASGEWNISAYPRLSKLTSLPTNAYSILLTSKTTGSSAYYTDDLALVPIYDGQQYQHALKLPDLCMGSISPSDCLSRKTINIAGTDVNIWGGTLSANNLIESLQTNGIKANALIIDQEIGSNTTPVYFSSDGIPIACDNVHATSATSADSASKLNTSAGNENTPVYFEDGVPIACTSIYATTDVAKKLIDDNNNNLNAGSFNTPVYFNNGIPMECTDLTTRNITANTLELGGNDGQGGKLTLSSGTDKIGELMINPLTNTFASICYLPPDQRMESNKATLLSEIYIKGREEYTYGTIFPSVNLEEGQIFFKINENGTKENETNQGYWITATPYIYQFNNETI